MNYKGIGPYRTEKGQMIFLENQSRYYKTYVTTKSPKINATIWELEPLKLSGGKLQLEEIKPSNSPKDKALMIALAKYKFLTTEQMLCLKLSNHSSGLPTSKLEKSGFIKSVRVQIEKSERNIKMFFLTKKGAKFMKSELGEDCQINYPTSGKTKVSQVGSQDRCNKPCYSIIKV